MNITNQDRSSIPLRNVNGSHLKDLVKNKLIPLDLHGSGGIFVVTSNIASILYNCVRGIIVLQLCQGGGLYAYYYANKRLKKHERDI